MNRVALFAACLAGAVSIGCGPKEFGSVCDTVPAPSECQTACDPSPGAANNCPAGFHCAPGGQCDAQCTQGGGQCGPDYTCTSDGYCVDGSGPPMNGPDANCPAVTFTPQPVTPSIQLVLDQSGSMWQQIGPGVTRYAAMREALVGTAGVVTQLESKAYFGSLLYTCPSFTSIARALNNAAAIRTSIDSKTGGDNTPTHEAINAAVQDFQANPPPAGSPPAIVLATDGLPNLCGAGVDTRNLSVQAAQNAFAAGIPVYVLAINQSDSHFQDLANAGQGMVGATYYPVTNATALAAAFQTIINGVISCDLSLTSNIDPAQAMTGTVTLNGTTLMYGSDWVLVNNNIIRLQGQACQTLKSSSSPSVQATFQCGSVIL